MKLIFFTLENCQKKNQNRAVLSHILGQKLVNYGCQRFSHGISLNLLLNYMVNLKHLYSFVLYSMVHCDIYCILGTSQQKVVQSWNFIKFAKAYNTMLWSF